MAIAITKGVVVLTEVSRQLFLCTIFSLNYSPSTILSNFLVNANMITPQAMMIAVTVP